MKITILGGRGSTPAPGDAFRRFGGHTSCIAVSLDDGGPTLLLDAGTGIRNVAAVLGEQPFRGTVLLGHLHWDHTAGLPFFDVTTKAGDNRAAWFVKRYGNRCYELDALDPNDLRERVQEQIVTSLDLLAWERAKEVEQAEVASMRSFHRAWNAQLRQRGGA